MGPGEIAEGQREVDETVVVRDRSADLLRLDGAVEESLAVGTRLGPWEIVGLIGQGGMGEVYEAHRADGVFALKVAIKLLKRGVDTQAVLRRFLAERRILAQLVHPNIAHALDAGVAPDGRPYLVMEHVAGRPITAYLRARGATLPEMLRLMITVCHAVQEAHRRQIVHRDLKPSNVLVTDDGQVKLLDFGIAKSLDEDAVDATRIAGEGTALTLAYAAPEQLHGGAVTPAVDVYALGVIVYELLTARLPHDRDRLRPGQPRLTEATTVRPSAVLRAERGRFAETEREARLRALPRDLDLIVLKALHPEVGRRYANAQALADDLQRLLEHRPVLARPDSLVYRAVRFVRRNRLVVAAAAAVVVALCVGLTIALWQAGVARAQARAAQLQQQRAEQVKNFMLSVFKEQDPNERQGPSRRTPLQLIEAASARVDREFAGDPEIHAEVQVELAEIRARLGDFNGGRAMLERLLTQQRSSLGNRSLPVARSLIALARGHAQEKGDQSPEIEPAVREALTILDANRVGDTAIRAEANLLLGRSLGSTSSRATEALQLLSESQRIATVLDGSDGAAVIDARMARAGVLDIAGRSDEALLEYRAVLDETERRYGAEHYSEVLPLSESARILIQKRKFSDAASLLQRATAIRRREFGTRAPFLARDLSLLGQAYAGLNRYDEARRAFDEGEAALPAGDESAEFYFRYPRMQFEQAAGIWPEAEADARRLVVLARKLYGDGYVFRWWAQASLGYVLAMEKRHAEAERALIEARDGLRAAVGKDAYDNYFPASILGVARVLAGRATDALEPLREALALIEASDGAGSANWASNALNLAEALIAVGAPETRREAGTLVDRALATLADGEDRVMLAKGLIDRALIELAAGNMRPAAKDLDRAQSILEQDGGRHDEDLARITAARRRFEPGRRAGG